MMNYKFIILGFCFLCSSCKENNKLTEIQCFVFDYFSNLSFENYQTIKDDDVSYFKYKIDGKLVTAINWRRNAVLKDFSVTLHDSYQKNNIDSNEGFCKFSNSSHDEILSQLLNYNGESAFNAMEGMLRYASENNHEFQLLSGKHFIADNQDFVTYSAKTKIDTEEKYSMGLICMIEENLFLDFTYVLGDIRDIDYILFSEMINSIEYENRILLPLCGSIKEIRNISL